MIDQVPEKLDWKTRLEGKTICANGNKQKSIHINKKAPGNKSSNVDNNNTSYPNNYINTSVPKTLW